jgi:HD-GYP domain-containing protein (c-di-GMP phosphodiesterase class II)
MSSSQFEKIWQILERNATESALERERNAAEKAKEAAERAKEAAERKAAQEQYEAERAKEAAERKAAQEQYEAERAKEAAERKAAQDKFEAERKAAWQKFEKGMEELREEQRENARQLKELKVQVSGVSDNEGYGAETYFQTALGKSLNFAGIQFDEMYPNLQKRRHGDNCEFDIVLVNHDAVAIIDAKHRVHREQVAELAKKKTQIFRTFFPEYKDYKLYLGLAGFSVGKGVESEARDYGVGLLKQNGDAIETVHIPLKAY